MSNRLILRPTNKNEPNQWFEKLPDGSERAATRERLDEIYAEERTDIVKRLRQDWSTLRLHFRRLITDQQYRDTRASASDLQFLAWAAGRLPGHNPTLAQLDALVRHFPEFGLMQQTTPGKGGRNQKPPKPPAGTRGRKARTEPTPEQLELMKEAWELRENDKLSFEEIGRRIKKSHTTAIKYHAEYAAIRAKGLARSSGDIRSLRKTRRLPHDSRSQIDASNASDGVTVADTDGQPLSVSGQAGGTANTAHTRTRPKS